ncbi:MAG: hypothetical protein JJU40_09490 [Rhodobacteraceae bacterium]|nr:hypothetical protein [Paracoccaceae bacterium]
MPAPPPPSRAAPQPAAPGGSGRALRSPRGGILRFPELPPQGATDEGIAGGADGTGGPAIPEAAAAPSGAGRAARPAIHWRRLPAGPVSLVLAVLLPVALSAWYLWARAADQYVAHAGFSVRQEEAGTRPDLAAALAGLSRASSSDTDILRAFIRSREMVARVDARLGLAALWAGAAEDPVFAFRGTARGDLAQYGRRMVHVSHDPGAGLIVLRLHAFTPEDALALAEAVLEESAEIINTLSDTARARATPHALAERAAAEERLLAAQEALARARAEARLRDPSADAGARAALLAGLEVQLTEALVAADLLRATTRESDPRLAQEERRITVLRARIEDERARFGVARPEAEDYATLLARFERLELARDVAEEAWRAALLAQEAAQAEARRQTRHLAVHERPALPERAEAPRRVLMLAAVAVACFLLWAVAALVWLSIRDRA